MHLAFVRRKDSGKATGAQTLELLPQRLDDFGLALLRLVPQVLRQLLALQRPQRVAGARRCARETLGVDGTPVGIRKGRRAVASPRQPVLLALAFVLGADLHVVIVVFPVVLEVGHVVLGGAEYAQSRSPVQDHHLLTVTQSELGLSWGRALWEAALATCATQTGAMESVCGHGTSESGLLGILPLAAQGAE